ncbi:MAG: hypothetical protein RIS41_1678 [Actinomycetota bacterium]|jgi:hypothetical protein
MKSTRKPRPLVLLDVDGVINDLGALYAAPDASTHDVVRSHGFRVVIPKYMPVLVQWLCSVADVHWCTTWRHRANDEIATHLGIPTLPVVDDGTKDRHTSWKAAAARDLAAAALAEGRRVVWIEDFYGDAPRAQMPKGVEFVDTALDDPFDAMGAVLSVDMIPEWLWALDETPRTTPGSSSDSSGHTPKAA